MHCDSVPSISGGCALEDFDRTSWLAMAEGAGRRWRKKQEDLVVTLGGWWSWGLVGEGDGLGEEK